MPRPTVDGLCCPRCSSGRSKVIRTIHGSLLNHATERREDWVARTRICKDCGRRFLTEEWVVQETNSAECIDNIPFTVPPVTFQSGDRTDASHKSNR